jgi:hypothetical protein
MQPYRYSFVHRYNGTEVSRFPEHYGGLKVEYCQCWHRTRGPRSELNIVCQHNCQRDETESTSSKCPDKAKAALDKKYYNERK